MISRHLLKLRTRRVMRRTFLRGRGSLQQTGTWIEQNGFARFGHLRRVWQVVTAWLLVAVLLGAGLLVQLAHLKTYYQRYEPIPGGRFAEGVVGSFTTANPLYAINEVDTAVSRLVFASLLTYDEHGQLAGDLAESWSADPTGKVYTVRLKPNLTWQDGEPLTTDDVAYTYHTIQNPDAHSPLLASWQGVTVTAIDDRVVTFALPNPLSSFPSSLTNGIVPKHILGAVAATDLRSSAFNTARPIGAGPFRWGAIGLSGAGDQSEVQISLLPFDHYWHGTPKLTSFIIHTYASKDRLIAAYQTQQLTAVAGLDTIPAALQHISGQTAYRLPLNAGVYVFFRTTAGVLGNTKVRQALVLASDRNEIIDALHQTVSAVDEPLLPGQVGYDAAYQQQTSDTALAKATLDADGWSIGSNGIRVKDGKPLSFTLTINDNPDYATVAHLLQTDWRAVGADVQVLPRTAADFQAELQGQQGHDYQAVLYGISIGTDPDVYVYWDSSQNDLRSATRFNFSEYASNAADVALEAGRTRLDPGLRAIKYKSFLQAWQQDNPALALYRPNFLYLSHMPIYGLDSSAAINTDAGRYTNVQNWEIDKGWVTH